MPSKIPTKSDLIALVRSKLGDSPKLQAIADLLASEEIEKGEAYIRTIKSEIDAERMSSRAALHTLLVAKLNPSPTLADVKRVCESVQVKLPENAYRTIHRKLKLSHPEMWDGADGKKYTLRLGASDKMLFEKFTAMTGKNRNDNFSLLIRAFVLAASRGQINIAELLPRTNSLNQVELQMLSKILNLDLKGL